MKLIKSEKLLELLEGVGVVMRIMAFGMLSVMGKDTPFLWMWIWNSIDALILTYYHIGNGSHLTMKSSTIVEMHDYLKIMTGEGKGITLDVEIKADFNKIPPEYHQLFCQMMMVRYGGIVNIWDNTQPFAKPEVKKKKWYQFWK